VLDRASETLPFLYHFCFFWVVKFQGIWPYLTQPTATLPLASAGRRGSQSHYQRLSAVIVIGFFPSKRVPCTKCPSLATRSGPRSRAGVGALTGAAVARCRRHAQRPTRGHQSAAIKSDMSKNAGGDKIHVADPAMPGELYISHNDTTCQVIGDIFLVSEVAFKFKRFLISAP